MPIAFFAGLVASLLPAELRPKWFAAYAGNIRVAAITSGLMQLAACLLLLLVRFPAFVKSQAEGVSPEAHMAAMEQGGESAIMGLGIVFFIAYVLRPLSLMILYFAFEGIVRAAAAFVHNEPVGTLPLYVLLLAGRKTQKEVHEYRMGERIPDKVVFPKDGEQSFDLLIASCRPKDWHSKLTISYQEQLYELADSHTGDAPQPFVYKLRKAPQSKVVRGLHVYDPEEVLDREKDKRY